MAKGVVTIELPPGFSDTPTDLDNDPVLDPTNPMAPDNYILPMEPSTFEDPPQIQRDILFEAMFEAGITDDGTQEALEELFDLS